MKRLIKSGASINYEQQEIEELESEKQKRLAAVTALMNAHDTIEKQQQQINLLRELLEKIDRLGVSLKITELITQALQQTELKP